MNVEDLSGAQRRFYEASVTMGMSESAALQAAVGHEGAGASSPNSFDRLAGALGRLGSSVSVAQHAAAGRRMSVSEAREVASNTVPDLTGVAGEIIEAAPAGRSRRELLVAAVAERFRRQGASDPERRAVVIIEATEGGMSLSPQLDRLVAACAPAKAPRLAPVRSRGAARSASEIVEAWRERPAGDLYTVLRNAGVSAGEAARLAAKERA